MKKAMPFFGVLLVLAPLMVWAAANETNGQADMAMAGYVPGNPLMKLPGMNSGHSLSSLVTTPIPAELITNVSNAPNPFDSRKSGLLGQTRISYTLAQDSPVRVTIYDLLGFRVRRWDFSAGQNGARNGDNAFMWDGTNENGQKVSKGGYLAQIEIETPETVVTVIRKIGVIH